MNRVTLSDDRQRMTIVSEDGQRQAKLASARDDGFTDEHVWLAMFDFQFDHSPGTRAARRWNWLGREFTVHTSVGPPTWWMPLVHIRRDHVMVGWLRGMVAVHW